MEPILAYCGLLCTDCPSFIATQAGDDAALDRVLAQWRVEYDNPSLKPEDIPCDSCPDSAGRKMSHCFECDIRACAQKREVANCAHCPDYACERMHGFLAFVPDARARLDAICVSLDGL